MLLYIRWITKSIPNPKEIYLTQRKSILRRGELVAFFFLYPYATDKRRERLRKRKKSLLLAKHLSLGFSLSRKRAAFRGTKVSDEKYIRQKRQSSSWTGEQNLQQTRQCGKVVEVGLITANTAPNSPQTMRKWLQVKIQPEHRLKNACYQQFGSSQRTETTRQQRPAAMA